MAKFLVTRLVRESVEVEAEDAEQAEEKCYEIDLSGWDYHGADYDVEKL